MPNFINANPRLFLIAFTAFVNLVVVGLRSFTGYEVPQEFVGAVNTLAVALATLIVGDTIKDRDVVAAKILKEHGIEFRASSRGVASFLDLALVACASLGVGFAVVVCACSPDQPSKVADAATCSPLADAWYQVELHRVCGNKETDECPAVTEARSTYLEMEAAECSKKP